MPLAARQHSRRVIPAVFALLAGLGAQPSSANPANPPTQLEQDFWRSSQQIGTADAYKAYLAAYPQGFFARLARAALEKSPTPAAATITTEAAGNSRPTPPTAAVLERIAGPVHSAAVSLRVGDLYLGPGPLTIGWLGNKKQIVVPAGHWVVVGAQDELSTHPETSVALAQVDGPDLRALLIFTVNNRPGNTSAVWLQAQACELASTEALFAWVASGPQLRQCAKAHQVDGILPSTQVLTTFLQVVRANLARMEVRIPRTAALRTEMYITGHLSNYIKLARYDPLPNATTPLTPQSAAAERLRSWSHVYGKYAAVGYKKDLHAGDLHPGDTVPVPGIDIPDLVNLQ